MTTIAYHFVGETLRDGRAVPANYVWLKEAGEIKLCHKGLHASLHPSDACRYAPGLILCLVELKGKIIKGDDKLCAKQRRIIARFDATDLLRKDARDSALSVIHLWKAPDIVRKYLETGDESIRLEARQAAYAAASAAASAASAASAAYAAASAASAASAAASAASAASAAYAAASAAYAVASAAYAVASAAYAVASAAYAADAAAAASQQKHIAASRLRLKTAVDSKFSEMGVKL